MFVTKISSSLPLYAFAISLVGYCFGRLVLAWITSDTTRTKLRLQAASNATAGTIDAPKAAGVAEEERFELEKRAFFSNVSLKLQLQGELIIDLLFGGACNDLIAVVALRIQFFIVLGQDLKLRAFHNVCRHRAYTVVRKSCGTTKLFSCKYHGWQYDHTGSLVMAPKFDLSPGFRAEENGLFEVKLLRTQEGLVRVNFDASTLGHPYRDMTSSLGMGDSTWIDGFDKETKINWKTVGAEFSSQAQWYQSTMSWLPRLRKPKIVQMLGPLAMLREMGDDVWCTMKVLPETAHSTKIRCDFYARAGYAAKPRMTERYKLIIKKELIALQLQQNGIEGTVAFSYEVGGRNVDLAAILSQHQRSEMLAKRKLQPRIRLGQDHADVEAEALCNVLDSKSAATGAYNSPSETTIGIEW